jgi:hypothetical protein
VSIINQLSSHTGDRTEYSNRKVATLCLDNSDLLVEIVIGLTDKNLALVGDCAEVMTMVAIDHPEWVAPYAEHLANLIASPNTRVRWEAMHALSLVSGLAPTTIESLLPRLAEILHVDASVIVRDHATDALAGYASSSASAALAAYPLLNEMLTLWNGKQAGHALNGLRQVAGQLPSLRPELRRIANEFTSFPRPVVRKAAKTLLRALDSLS